MCMYPFCCVFSYVSSGHMDKMIHDYTDCISLTYFHHVISHICVLRTLGSEHANLHWLHFFDFFSPCVFIHICVRRTLGCEHANLHCLVYLHCVSSSVSLKEQLEKMHSCTCCNWMVFRHYVGSKHFYNCMHSHTDQICMAFQLCFIKCVLKWSA